MATSLQRLPLPILAQCSEHLNQESLSQLALVSKFLHLASRYRRNAPKHLDCTYESQEVLAEELERITLHAQSVQPQLFVPPFGSLTYSIGEWGLGDSEAEKVKTAIQILNANKGVMLFSPEVKLHYETATREESVLLALSELAAAASICKDSTSDLRVIGTWNSHDAHSADLKVKTIFERLSEKYAVASMTLQWLKLDNFRQSLEETVGVTSVSTLNLSGCNLSQDGATQIIRLPGLETLTIRDTAVPIGIIIGNAASLRKLRIGPHWSKRGISTIVPFRAHFPKLSEFTIQVDEKSSEECSIREAFLFNSNVSMPALSRLGSTVRHALTCASDFGSVLDRLPSLRRLTLKQWLRDSEVPDSSTRELDPHHSNFHAFVKACERHNVTLVIQPSNYFCANRTEVDAELQRVGELKEALWSYELAASIDAFEKSIDHDEPVTFPKLLKLSLVLSTVELDRTQGEVEWGDNLADRLRKISAPKCKEMELVISGRAEVLGTIKGFLQDLVAMTNLPELARVAGRCSIRVPRNVSLNPTLHAAVSELKTAIAQLGMRTGTDFDGFEVIIDRQY